MRVVHINGRRLLTAVQLCCFSVLMFWSGAAAAEIFLAEQDGWKLTTDGRLNIFVSFAKGTEVPSTQPAPEGFRQYPGAGTDDVSDTDGKIQSVRIRNGFMPNILGFQLTKEVRETFAVSGRVALWMNVGEARTKNVPGPIDPRELWLQLEGPWGKVRGGSDLSLFGRGGILVNFAVGHEYGLGYPCTVENTAGGACGHVAFGTPFPGFDPGIVYTTPNLVGIELAVGAYDPVQIQHGGLLRTPLPRVEAELSYDLKELLKVFVNAHWQRMEGKFSVQDPMTNEFDDEIRKADARGAQAGAMVTLGPVMLGGAAFKGSGLTPFTHVGEDLINADSEGVLRDSEGAFGMGAFSFMASGTKIAAGYGFMHLDKTENDSPAILGELAQNPGLFKQNRGISFGVYQQAGPVHFAAEYFRAETRWHDFAENRTPRENLTDLGSDDPNSLTVIDLKEPNQAVNFINVGMSLLW